LSLSTPTSETGRTYKLTSAESSNASQLLKWFQEKCSLNVTTKDKISHNTHSYNRTCHMVHKWHVNVFFLCVNWNIMEFNRTLKKLFAFIKYNYMFWALNNFNVWTLYVSSTLNFN
jgi:hypothetical protein